MRRFSDVLTSFDLDFMFLERTLECYKQGGNPKQGGVFSVIYLMNIGLDMSEIEIYEGLKIPQRRSNYFT